MLTAAEALERLRAGNRRFAADLCDVGEVHTRHVRRSHLLAGQEPFAIVLGCSDSRVPAEIVFGQGIGDLFVIRVAGNIVAPSQIGSVEFAATAFGTRLVVVLGHSQCGAILTTMSELRQPQEHRSPNLDAIVRRVRPSLKPLLQSDLQHDPEALMCAAVRANIRASVEGLQRGSDAIERLIQADGLVIVGAEYSIETGLVEFLDEDAPAQGQA